MKYIYYVGGRRDRCTTGSGPQEGGSSSAQGLGDGQDSARSPRKAPEKVNSTCAFACARKREIRNDFSKREVEKVAWREVPAREWSCSGVFLHTEAYGHQPLLCCTWVNINVISDQYPGHKGLLRWAPGIGGASFLNKNARFWSLRVQRRR